MSQTDLERYLTHQKLSDLAESILDTVLNRYRQRRKEVIYKLYVQGLTKAQIAKKLKLSPMWVGTIINERLQEVKESKR